MPFRRQSRAAPQLVVEPVPFMGDGRRSRLISSSPGRVSGCWLDPLRHQVVADGLLARLVGVVPVVLLRCGAGGEAGGAAGGVSDVRRCAYDLVAADLVVDEPRRQVDYLYARHRGGGRLD